MNWIYDDTEIISMSISKSSFLVTRRFSSIMALKENWKTSYKRRTFFFFSRWSNLLIFWSIVDFPYPVVNKPQKDAEKKGLRNRVEQESKPILNHRRASLYNRFRSSFLMRMWFITMLSSKSILSIYRVVFKHPVYLKDIALSIAL